MLVQALAAYADTYLQDELGDPAFESKPVGCIIEIYDDGRFARLARHVKEVTRGKKNVVVDLPLLVPKSPVNRNSCVYALPGCDAVQYVVGPGSPWTKKDGKSDETEKHQKHHAGFVERVAEVASAIPSPSWKAAIAFCRDASQVAKARDALSVEKVKSGTITFRVVAREGGAAPPIVEEEVFKEWWRQRFAKDAGGRVRVDATRGTMCLVSGAFGSIARTHEKIKGTSGIGGQPSGVLLMSFDKTAFRSYGWDQNENSPVSPSRATAYVLALNDLLKPGKHRRGASDEVPVSTRYDAGGTAFLFWTARPTDDDWAALLNSPSGENVRALLDSVRTGRGVDTGDPTDFFLVAVAGNGGRLVVRYWLRDSVAATRARLVDWFSAMRIAAPLDRGRVQGEFPLWKLLLATEREGAKVDDVAPGFAVHLMRRALFEAPLGHAFLAAILRRLRLAGGAARLAPARMGLLRMCLNDLTTRNGSGGTMITETLDESLRHPAYLCGRLLAVFDGLQYQAQKEVGTTVVDRYYALASTNPAVAFPKIEQLGQHHLKKLRRDKPAAATAIGRRLSELHEAIATSGARFPGQLNLEDQGRFAIGFHHQKAEDQARIASAKAEREAAVSS